MFPKKNVPTKISPTKFPTKKFPTKILGKKFPEKKCPRNLGKSGPEGHTSAGAIKKLP